MNNQVSIGPTTIIGWASAVLALIPTVVKAIESGTTALAGPEKYLAITGIILGAVTQIGRYLQAHKLIGLNVDKAIEDIGNVFPKPESAVTPDGPKAV